MLSETQPNDAVSPLASAILPLVQSGYLPFLRPAAPPNAELLTKRGPKISDGKLPSLYRDGRWHGFRWPELAPTTTDVGIWSTWPKASLCLVTGEICALDIDIKYEQSDTNPAATAAKQLIRKINDIVTDVLKVDRLPVRSRSNSTSCALLFRVEGGTTKRTIDLLAPPKDGNRERCKIELLGRGQQLIIAGWHASGVQVSCSLAEFDIRTSPTATVAQLDEIFARIAAACAELGFETCGRNERRAVRSMQSLSPEEAVARLIFARRRNWIPFLLPFDPLGGDEEWRVSSEALNRDLEEDLAIYPDGIHDFGTERSHSPLSFIMEFGALLADGSIAFIECPRYGQNGKKPFAVVGEHNPSVERPNEAQAVTWLCRTVFDPDFPEQQTWRGALPAMAAALGLDWSALCTVEAQRVFNEISEDGSESPFAPETWSSDDLRNNAHLLPAMRAMEPERFSRWEFAWDMIGAIEPLRLRSLIDDQQSAHREKAISAGYAVDSEAGASSEQSDWTEPRDVFGDSDPARLTELPRGCLPEVLEKYARDVSVRMGAPEAFAVGAELATLAGAIGSKWRIQPKEHDTGWTEPAFLWFGIIEEPGGKKSPIISVFTSPLSKLDAEYASEDGRKHREWIERRSRRKRGDPDIGPEPAIRRKVVEVFTMEALTNVLRDNPAGVLVRQDELTQLIGGLDAYKTKSGADRPMLLSLADGRDMRVDRASKGTMTIPCWGAAVIGGIQPDKISEMASNLDADGLLQRFIPIVGDGVRRSGVDRRPDAEAIAEYDTLIREIARAEPLMPEPIRLSPEAHGIWRELGARIESLYELPNLSSAWKGHLGKWQGFGARILLVLHVAEHWKEAGGALDQMPVTPQTARRAVRLIEWLLSHAISFYERNVGIGEAGDDARWIAGHILSGDRRARITRRDLGQAKSEFRDPPDRVVRAMRYLEVMGWCNPVAERTDKYGARRWTINPAVFERFRPRAETERVRRAEQKAKIAEAAVERRRILAAKGDD